MRPSWKNRVAGCGSLEVYCPWLLLILCILATGTSPLPTNHLSPGTVSPPVSQLFGTSCPTSCLLYAHTPCMLVSVCLQQAVFKAPRFSHSSGVTPHSSQLSLVPISKRNRKTPVLNLLLPSASHCSAKLWGMGRPTGGLWTAKR